MLATVSENEKGAPSGTHAASRAPWGANPLLVVEISVLLVTGHLLMSVQFSSSAMSSCDRVKSFEHAAAVVQRAAEPRVRGCESICTARGTQ